MKKLIFSAIFALFAVPTFASAADTINISTVAELRAAISSQTDGQTWIITAGDYPLDRFNDITVEGQSGWYFPITANNLTIIGEGSPVIYGNEFSLNGNWSTQNLVSIFGNNVTLKGVTLMPKAEGNKTIEVLGNDVTLEDLVIRPNTKIADSAYDGITNAEDRAFSKEWGGSIYFSHAGNHMVKNVTINNGGVSFRYSPAGTNITFDNVNLINKTADNFINGYRFSSGFNDLSNTVTGLPKVTYQVDASTKNLTSALAGAKNGDTVELTSDITTSSQINITKAITLNGNGNTLHAAFAKTDNSNNSAIGVGTSTVTIKNLTVDGTGGFTWPLQLHGINVYKSTDVILDAVTVKDFKGSGIVVNGSNVAATNLNTSGNAWNAVNIDPGSGVAVPSVFTLNSGTLTEPLQIKSDGTNVTDAATVTVNASGYTKYTIGGTAAGFVWANALGNAATITKNDVSTIYTTVQAAVTAAESGDTISVAPGTYTEVGQIVIDKNLSIIGADKNSTIMKPAQDTAGNSVDAAAWILVNPGITFTLSNITLDGNSSARKINWAIATYGSSTIDNIVIKNVKYGTYTGRGVVVFGTTTISNSSFQNIERIGIHVRGAYSGSAVGNAAVVGNTFTGKGSGDFLDYGIEVGAGASATISNNTISNNRGVAVSDGSTSAGILVTDYYGTGTSAAIIGNTLLNNSAGIAVGYNETDISTVSAHQNQFIGNSVAIISTHPTVDASLNYWGTAVPDFGTSTTLISGNVTVTPWYINPGRTTLNTDVSGGEITVTASSVDFEETADGNVSLPEGVTELSLSNNSVLSFASNTNTKTGTDIVVGGATTSLTTFTISGSTTTVDLSVPQTVGGKTVTIEKAVTLSSGSSSQPIILTNSSVSNISVSIPDTTTILAPSGWNGTIAPPTTVASSGSAPSGFSVGSTVVSIGSPDVVLIFDKPVTVTLEGVTGAVGYKSAGSDQWVTITSACIGTYENPTGAVFPGECKVSDGTNTKILTYHFTTFGSLSAIPAPVSSGGSYFVTLPSTASNVATLATNLSASTTGQVLGTQVSAEASQGKAKGQVLGAAAYSFNRNLRFGTTGDDVLELQKMLMEQGYLKIKTATKWFGPLTKAAVIKWQIKNSLPATGYFGPMSRALVLK